MIEGHRQEVGRLIAESCPEWPAEVRERVVAFYELLAAENEIQNLTRLITPSDFVLGHVLDVRALLNSGLVEFPAMDLGSGGGVPGLLAAVVRPDSWLLVDSEARKADFLRRTADRLALEHVDVVAGRAEAVLEERRVASVVARAVGTVEKIGGWLAKCSTWNTLVLLKGPGWADEWSSFEKSRQRGRLRPVGEYSYEIGPEKKKRVIIRLARVPRGTSK